MSFTSHFGRRKLLAAMVLVSTFPRASLAFAQASPETGDACAAVPGAPTEPYAAHYASGSSSLTVIAAQHSSDLQAPTNRLVARLFAGAKPDLVLIEGLPASEGRSPSGFAPALASLTPSFRGGEARYAAALAAADGVPFQGIEPRDQDVNTAVLARFSPTDLLGSLVLRALPSQASQAPAEAPRFADAISARYRRSDPRLAAVTERFADWYKAAYGVEPWSDGQLLRRATPCSAGLAGDVIKLVTAIRNQHILDQLSHAVPSAHAVALVVGSGHYRALAPELTERFGVPIYSAL